MSQQEKISRLNVATLLFPLALVLFEFAVYIGNDMAQPAMLRVVQEFGVDVSWVPLSMTAYLLGGALLPWLSGPLSDRFGRRPVLLFGVAWFTASCLATYLVSDIHSYMLLRVLQGFGLCFINAVGYAAIQEAYAETTAVRVTALMANVALIAPLAGPLAGAALITLAPWRTGFLLIALCSLFALIGLWWKMPETVQPSAAVKLTPRTLWHGYTRLLRDGRFVRSALCIPLLAMPLMAWIALSPVLLVEDLHLSALAYGLWQIPVFAGLIGGNLLLALVAERWPLGRSVLVGMWPLVGGLLLMLGGVLYGQFQHVFLALGMSLMALGEGLSFAVLYRFALTASPQAKGIVSAGMSMLSMAGYALGIELFRWGYLAGGIPGFALLSVCTALGFVWLARPQVKQAMADRADPDLLPQGI
ncbi:MFS transporter [Vogesella oryzae]|uniref:MFS transporter n=1 Tax=Vogesella oryzae TaxID=1735285 RepID=UPI001581733B|nr:MFS transporter [Vogesella oryzae]